MTAIHLHIDELVLHGFDPRQRHAIADTVQAELSRLMAESARTPAPTPIESSHHRRIDAGSFALATGTPPVKTAAQLAGVLHSAIQPLIAGTTTPPEQPHG